MLIKSLWVQDLTRILDIDSRIYYFELELTRVGWSVLIEKLSVRMRLLYIWVLGRAFHLVSPTYTVSSRSGSPYMPIYTIRVSYRSSVAASERESETESETWAIPLFVESIAGKVRNQRILLRFTLLDGFIILTKHCNFLTCFLVLLLFSRFWGSFYANQCGIMLRRSYSYAFLLSNSRLILRPRAICVLIAFSDLSWTEDLKCPKIHMYLFSCVLFDTSIFSHLFVRSGCLWCVDSITLSAKGTEAIPLVCSWCLLLCSVVCCSVK